MTSSKMLDSGSPILTGDSTTPGIKIHREVMEQLPLIFRSCRDYGLDFYPTIINCLRYDEISEIASYGGFPVRYPHWRFGMEYEQLSRGYEYGMHRISEMVVNNNPCHIYFLDSNTLVDNINVIIHALAHNDFFKNNVFFRATDTNMMNTFASNAACIRRYMARWGKHDVTQFIDHCLRVETLIDPAMAWHKKRIRKVTVQDERVQHPVERIKPTNQYMEDWVNRKEDLDKKKDEIERKEIAEQMGLFTKQDKDVFGYLRDHAPLRPWQQDVIARLHGEAMYFAPQMQTKMLNEGWAKYVDFNLMSRQCLASGQKRHDAGIVEYARHHMLVLGGRWSQNPYKMGFELLMDIEDRWNKGKFGREYEECQDINEKKRWNKHLGLGKERVFEVRKQYNDLTAITEFFTPELCAKLDFWEVKRDKEGEYKLTTQDFKIVKTKLIQRYSNGGLPDIRLHDPNHLGRNWLLLQHHPDGRPLHEGYCRQTLPSLWYFWKNPVVLASRDLRDREYVFYCNGIDPENNVKILPRDEYERELVK